jgi:hypothetical protein
MNNDLHITHRDASHAPIAGSLVDTFADKTYTDTDPFTATGACNTANTVELGNTGGTECAVDIGDTSTNAIGNLAVTVNGTGGETTNGTTWTYWAHTGAVGTAYDNDSPANSASLSSSTSATATVCTDDTSTKAAVGTGTPAGGDLVAYGSTVTITCQLKTALLAAVAMPLSPITIVDTLVVATDDAVGIDSTSEAAASSIVTTVLYTDATGAATYTVTAADPLATAATNRTEHTVVVTPTIGSATTFAMAFDDNPAINQSITVALGNSYGAGLATGVSRSATATVRDQYGNGMANKTVTFESSSTNSAADPFTDDVTRVTDSSGVATLGYTSLKTASAAVTVYAWLDNGTTKDGASSGTASDGTNDTPGAGGELDGNAVFYRTTAGAADISEVDAPTATVGTSFTVASATGVLTFGGSHGLVVGDEVQIIIVPATNSEAAAGITTVGQRFWVITQPSGTTLTLGTSRGGTAVAYTSASGTVGSNTAGTLGKLGLADISGDLILEFVVHDAANDTLVVSADPQSGNTTYVTYGYDSNDQFQMGADNLTQTPPTTGTFAAFETAVAGKFTLGVPDAAELGDLAHIGYKSTTTGIQLFQLGQ